MLHANAYIPILAAAAAEVVIGMVWYSDSLFGPMWKKMGGKAPAQKDLYAKLGMHFVASLVSAAALFIAISIFQKAQTGIYAQEGFFKLFSYFLQNDVQNNSLTSAMKTAGFVFVGFIAPTKAICTIWGSENWPRFLLETAGKLTGFLAMAAIIASLS